VVVVKAAVQAVAGSGEASVAAATAVDSAEVDSVVAMAAADQAVD